MNKATWMSAAQDKELHASARWIGFGISAMRSRCPRDDHVPWVGPPDY